MNPTFHIVTFGCKVNQCDSAMMAQALEEAGFTPAPAGTPPDLVLVNTCTVTARADQQARQAIRRLARSCPEASLWVTGCYAQRAPELLAGLPGVTGVFGNPEKLRVAEILGDGRPRGEVRIEVQDFRPREPFRGREVSRFPGHARAWLKIQEGCNHACAYCIVPRVRGPSRSLPPEEVMASFRRLAEAGYQEIVLTGVDLGQYGGDLPRNLTLARMLGALSGEDWAGRVRLSSLEPQGITGELLEALGSFPRLCPHFHLPLQSGSTRILQAMGRTYTPEDFRSLVMELSRRFPAAAIGVDILVGFPGETEVDFAATWELVSALPITYFHVFPFSPRPGTPAEGLPLISAPEVKRRAAALRNLGQRKKRAFLAAHLGQIGEVLVEGPLPNRSGWLRGVSGNYLRCLFPGPAQWRRQLLKVRYLRVEEDFLVGEVLSPPEGAGKEGPTQWRRVKGN